MMPAWLGKLMLRLNGMKVVDHNEGNWPAKAVCPTAPHTTNRDFPYGLYVRAAIRKNIQFVGKSTLFWEPLGTLLRWMGGVPVVRSKRTNFVQGVADVFNKRESFYLCVAIEGTRSK
ncbi:MAG: 1-acyl-sn-glycerol-3-phosphate acyltransferase, partial [Bacteroidota bacterium]